MWILTCTDFEKFSYDYCMHDRWTVQGPFQRYDYVVRDPNEEFQWTSDNSGGQLLQR